LRIIKDQDQPKLPWMMLTVYPPWFISAFWLRKSA